MTSKKHIDTLKIVILALILTLGLNYAHAQWTGPTAPPPGNNAPAPINVSGSGQSKAGWLTLGSTIAPGHALDVYGDIYGSRIVGTSFITSGSGGGYIMNSRDTNTSDSQWYSPQNGVTSLWSHRNHGQVLNINTQSNIFDMRGALHTQTLRVSNGAATGRVLTATNNFGDVAWQTAPSSAPSFTSYVREVNTTHNLGVHTQCFLQSVRADDPDDRMWCELAKDSGNNWTLTVREAACTATCMDW